MNMRVYDDRKTPELVERLKSLWVEQARARNPELYRDAPAEDFPQVTDADQNTPNYSPLAIPDRHYYDAAGQEPGMEPLGFPIWGYVFGLLFGLALVFFILLLCLVVIPEAYKLYFKVCGC